LLDDIQVLSDLEHVLKRSSRYIGVTTLTDQDIWYYNMGDDYFTFQNVEYIPALIKLFDEVISNSVDVAIKTNFEYANKIDVTVDDNFEIIITDNGCGLKTDIEPKTGLPMSVVAFTSLRAGSKFDDDSSSIGQNGEGVSLVNIFSKSFDVDTSNGKERTILSCSDNLSNMTYDIKKSRKKYTKVSFVPDYKFFGIDELDGVHINLIYKRILDLSACYPQITFTYNGKKLQTKTFKDYVKMYGNDFKIFETEDSKLAILPTDEFQSVSFVNGIECKRGGIHIHYLMAKLSDDLREVFGKKYKEIKPADIKNKTFVIYVMNNVIAPRFDSQTKEYLNDFNGLGTYIGDVYFGCEIVDKLSVFKEYKNNIIDAYRVKEELKKRKELAKKENSIQKVEVPKLVEANSKFREDCSLFISEGDSAVSRALSVRDKEHHAIFPLRGKFMNVLKKGDTDIIKNKEIQNLLSIMGLRLTDPDISSCRYGQINILCDADIDGQSIIAQLLNFFYKYWTDLFEQGKINIILSPLIIADTVNGEKTYYTYQEYMNDKSNVIKILEYNKGLGSLSKDQYYDIMHNPKYIKVSIDNLSQYSLELAFGKDAESRKSWLLGDSVLYE